MVLPKIALYSRVSTQQQTNENQKIRLLRYGTESKKPFDYFEETESTRKTRPVKAELMARLRSGEYQAVVIFRLDRWARSLSELVLDTKELVDKGVGFVSLSDSIDFGSASGRLHFQILCAFAEFERSLISERTREGLARAKKQGKFAGRPKGKKDKTKRRTSGYILRHAKKRKSTDEANGTFKPINDYIPQ